MTVASGGVILAASALNMDSDVVSVAVCAAVGLVVGGFCGFMVTPDIDHQWVTAEEQRIKRWFGGTVLFMWRVFWLPFLLPGHRSVWTHSWPRGTVLRQLWVAAWLVLALSIVISLAGADAVAVYQDWFDEWTLEIMAFLMALFVGWSWQDVVHLWMDSHIKSSG